MTDETQKSEEEKLLREKANIDRELETFFDEKKADGIRDVAKVVAYSLLNDALEARRKMLLEANLDVNKIKLICYKIEAIEKKMVEIFEHLEKIHKKLDDKFVLKESFSLVQKIVFSACALVLVAVVSSGVALIIIQ